MAHLTIHNAAQLAELCAMIRDADRVGFDTEFVSEDTYRPELCLVQVVVGDTMAVIDPQEVEDLTPFWEALADGDHTTIVHAAREEVNFSITAIDRPPANIFDTQLAAAFCSTEFPAAYSSVVMRFLDERLAKGEQRTDWRRRPLSDEQIHYALEDVRHLFPLHDQITEQINGLGRTEWFAAETDSFIHEVIAARGRKRWRKVSGSGNLKPRNLAVVRELWMWREEKARLQNKPAKRILRDDLIVELAKRKSDSVDRIRQIRGMQYSGVKRHLPEIADCVKRGLEADTKNLLPKGRGVTPPQLNVLGQFLAPAISSVCRRQQMAASLVGTASDIRDFIAFRLGYARNDTPEPSLATGWRADLVGNVIADLLDGKRGIRIDDPRSDHPLVIE